MCRCGGRTSEGGQLLLLLVFACAGRAYAGSPYRYVNLVCPLFCTLWFVRAHTHTHAHARLHAHMHTHVHTCTQVTLSLCAHGRMLEDMTDDLDDGGSFVEVGSDRYARMSVFLYAARLHVYMHASCTYACLCVRLYA